MTISSLDIAAAQFSEDSTPFLSPRRVSDLLGVTQSELAKLIGVARNTPTAASGARKVDQALSPIVRILAMAAEMAGDENRAVIWFKHQPIPGWAGKTAYDLVGEGKSDKVLAYLEAVRRRLCLTHLWRRRAFSGAPSCRAGPRTAIGRGRGPLRGTMESGRHAALTAACELSTAWAEYNQGFVQHPALIAQLELSGAMLADWPIRDPQPFRRGCRDPQMRMACRSRSRRGSCDPPPAGQAACGGIRWRNLPVVHVAGGTCVALWRWNGPGEPVADNHQIRRAPAKNAASWLRGSGRG